MPMRRSTHMRREAQVFTTEVRTVSRTTTIKQVAHFLRFVADANARRLIETGQLRAVSEIPGRRRQFKTSETARKTTKKVAPLAFLESILARRHKLAARTKL